MKKQQPMTSSWLFQTVLVVGIILWMIPGGIEGREDGEAVLTVETTNGWVKGSKSGFEFGRGREFLGIPYAQPPLGSLRLMPPQPLVSNWTGVLECTQFRNTCMQTGSKMLLMGEDCLNLNVWTPLDGTEPNPAPLPVMVYLYGGSWQYGSTAVPLYTGDFIIGNGSQVVIVTLNYRLGAFGFMGSSELAQLTPGGTTGNNGLLDQRLGLQWVRDNIARFGGDPTRVLLFGESAGAGSTSCHLIMPKSWGLFHRALMESGPYAHWTSRPLSEADVEYGEILDYVNCGANVEATPQDRLACLQAVPADLLVEARAHVNTYFTDYSPVIDGVEITDVPAVLASQGKLAPVPVLLGTNKNEGTLFSRNVSKTMTDEELAPYLEWRYGHALGSAAAAQYSPTDYSGPDASDAWWTFTYMATDMDFTCAARRTARFIAQAGQPVYLYQYTHLVDAIALFEPTYGVFHGSELIFVFDLPMWSVVDDALDLSEAEKKLAYAFVSYWTSFAAHGNPNLGDPHVPEWPSYSPDTDYNMDLNVDLQVNSGLRWGICNFWDKIFCDQHPNASNCPS